MVLGIKIAPILLSFPSIIYRWKNTQWFRDTLYDSKKLPQQPRHPLDERRKTELLSRRADIKGFNGFPVIYRPGEG